ncbi:TadE family protein [Crateriforma conspicua]|uniref:TadE family protein n=1 Tax=Crateriforma TaxID=2714592 RepID=UPI0018CD678B|nr:TadE family protein [Crateriforma conspicua]
MVEFAIIAPLMILFTFGLIEIGRLSMVKDTATHATREGARVGVRAQATTGDVVQRVQEELAVLGIESGAVTVTPALDGQPGSGSVTVEVRIPIDSISWVPNYFSFGVSDVVAETTMRRESTD